MALTLATVDSVGNMTRYAGGVGANDGDTVIDTSDVSRNDEFLLMSTAGAMQVFPSLDGTNYATDPLSLIDMGATTTSPVTATTANRIFGFYGTFAKVKVKQSGATAVTAATLVMSKKGSQF
ncbi:MAG TPA: hypothetical protein VFX20_18195 [Steroidobacteraceae bacterium]|nr:hypothetical protein [Steroidobacteraceae bacterium]